MAQPATFWARLLEVPKYYIGGLYRQMSEKEVFLWAQAIAFKVLVTIVPIVILATGILGRILGKNSDAFQNVAWYIERFVPYQSQGLIGILQQLQSASVTILSIGTIGLLFSLVTLFTTLRVVVASIYQEEWHIQRTILRGYAFDIRMAAQGSLLFLLSFGLTLGMQWLNAAGFEFFQEVGLTYVWLQEGWRRAFTAFGVLFPLLLSVAMFFQLFYFVPKPHPPKRSALLGAFVTAVLWEVAKLGFTFYASQAGRFSRYQIAPDEGGMSIFVNAFGLIIAFVFWVYYSGIVLCIGGLVGLLHEKRHRTRRKLKQVEELQRAEQEPGEPAPRRALAAQAHEGDHEPQHAKEDVPVG